MKKFTALLLALVFMTAVFAWPAGAVGFEPPFEISGKAAYIVNTDTNIIVYEKNSEESLPAASTTKLMTAILVMEQYQDQLDTVTGESSAYIRDTIYTFGLEHGALANADIRLGEPHTLRSLLYACLVPSAADAAMILASTVSGGNIDNFVYMMNSKAKEIGCTGTTFVDPVGMSIDNVTTARDLYLILRYAMSFDVLREIMGTVKWDMGQDFMPSRYSASNPYNLYTTNMMIYEGPGAEYYRKYTKGGKTGSLEDWQNLAAWHTSPDTGETYISVVLNSPVSCDPYPYQKDHPASYETGLLMDWVFENFAIQPAMKTGEPLAEVKVKYSTDADTVMLFPADDMMTILPKNTDESVTQKTFQLPEYVTAPVKKGDVIGTVTLSLSGQTIGVVELTADRDLDRNMLLFTLSKIGEFFGGLYFKVLLCVSAVTVVAYVLLYYRYQATRKSNRRPRRPSL